VSRRWDLGYACGLGLHRTSEAAERVEDLRLLLLLLGLLGWSFFGLRELGASDGAASHQGVDLFRVERLPLEQRLAMDRGQPLLGEDPLREVVLMVRCSSPRRRSRPRSARSSCRPLPELAAEEHLTLLLTGTESGPSFSLMPHSQTMLRASPVARSMFVARSVDITPNSAPRRCAAHRHRDASRTWLVEAELSSLGSVQVRPTRVRAG